MAYDPEHPYYDYEPGLTIEEVVQRWQRQRPSTIATGYRRGSPLPRQKMYDHAMPLAVPLEEVWPYREYTWSRGHARRSTDEWDELLASMRGGWNTSDPLLLLVGRESGVNVGEGNHRLAIARSLGFTEVPVRFVFQSGHAR